LRANRFVCDSKEAELCGLLRASSSGLLPTFAFAAKSSQTILILVATPANRCVCRGEPKIMLHPIEAVKQLTTLFFVGENQTT
jgi:hypothetical protein